MATRRAVPSTNDDPLHQRSNPGALDTPETKSNITPAVPTSVIVKLLLFTAAMVTVPIGTYFVSRHTLFNGNATFAGAAAAIMANVVLIGYVVVAMREDQGEAGEGEKGGKKTQ